MAVSYTHLDVYKRQELHRCISKEGQIVETEQKNQLRIPLLEMTNIFIYYKTQIHMVTYPQNHVFKIKESSKLQLKSDITLSY